MAYWSIPFVLSRASSMVAAHPNAGNVCSRLYPSGVKIYRQDYPVTTDGETITPAVDGRRTYRRRINTTFALLQTVGGCSKSSVEKQPVSMMPVCSLVPMQRTPLCQNNVKSTPWILHQVVIRVHYSTCSILLRHTVGLIFDVEQVQRCWL